MEIIRFVCNMVQENCYLAYDETREAVLIDCGAYREEEREAIRKFLTDNKLHLALLINTHGHFDHIFGAQFVADTYGVNIRLSQEELPTYTAAREQMRTFMHRDLPLGLPTPGEPFRAGDVLQAGNMKFEVIATPGHTPGGVCFYVSKAGILFSGDSLFRGSIGRCDLPGGNLQSLVGSLRSRILALPDEVTVLPGHGDATTVGDERQHNPYFQV